MSAKHMEPRQESLERPILFSAPMVRAILEGRKTQTRRVMKPQPHEATVAVRDIPDTPFWYGALSTKNDFGEAFYPNPAHGDWKWKCPQGVPGDRLWVKEATWLWCERRPNGKTPKGRQRWRYVPVPRTPPVYVADHPAKPDWGYPVETSAGHLQMWRYKTARFMPRNLSRLTLKTTDIRVQRVQDISEEDAKAEGRSLNKLSMLGYFPETWDSINAKRGFGWDKNPWVWALTFKQIPAPTMIDAQAAIAKAEGSRHA